MEKVSVAAAEEEALPEAPRPIAAIDSDFLSLVKGSDISFDASESALSSAKGTRDPFVRRVDFEEGDDGGVFSGLATTTLCFDVVKDLVGVLGASSNALTKDDMRGKLKIEGSETGWDSPK